MTKAKLLAEFKEKFMDKGYCFANAGIELWLDYAFDRYGEGILKNFPTIKIDKSAPPAEELDIVKKLGEKL